jgi:hypothetical protein
MRLNPDRLAGGKLKSSKDRGEWAELYFMMLAAGQDDDADYEGDEARTE